MLIGQAREQLSETFTAEIRRAFIRSLEHHSHLRALYTRRPTPVNPAHNPLAVPAVPAAVIDIRRHPSCVDATIVFTYKVEYGHPPYPILDVRPDWLSRVVRRDHVVLGGYPILDVLDRDNAGRPTAVRAARVSGVFDTTLHGWRASGYTHEAVVDWDGGGPTVTLGRQVCPVSAPDSDGDFRFPINGPGGTVRSLRLDELPLPDGTPLPCSRLLDQGAVVARSGMA